jgi:hypothetical protein
LGHINAITSIGNSNKYEAQIGKFKEETAMKNVTNPKTLKSLPKQTGQGKTEVINTKASVIISAVIALLLLPITSDSCTTVLIGKDMTADGSVIHAHNEDMGFSAVGRLCSVKAA